MVACDASSIIATSNFTRAMDSNAAEELVARMAEHDRKLARAERLARETKEKAK